MSDHDLQQLVLEFPVQETISFNNFFVGKNQELVNYLKSAVDNESGIIYLWGRAGTGKSHLLSAVSNQARDKGKQILILPLSETATLDVSILDGLEKLPLICLDDVHRVADMKDWEEALFHLVNRVLENETLLILTGREAPGNLSIALPDLKSRLGAGMVFHLEELQESEKKQALKADALQRGFDLSDEVLNYLLQRTPRDMHSLFTLLDRIDRDSLQLGRRITVPFIRKMLDGS